MDDLGIFGTSGFAREVADVAIELGYRVIFIARDKEEMSDSSLQGEVMLEEDIGRLANIHLAIGVGENGARGKIAERYVGKFKFPSLIHPTASFGRSQREAVSSRRGVIVCAGVRLTNNIDVGEFSILNLNATIGHDCIVGKFVNIAPGAHISGNVHIDEFCWIGTGAVVNQGTSAVKLTIGTGTIVGSGAVVTEDCAPNAVYVGVPARRIK